MWQQCYSWLASGSIVVRDEGIVTSGWEIQGDGVPHKSHESSNKIPMPGLGNLPLRVAGWGTVTTSQHKWAAAIALGCLPQLKGKTLLFKTPHTLETEPGWTKLKQTWNPLLWWPLSEYSKVLIVMQAVKGEEKLAVLHSCKVLNHNDWSGKMQQ